MSRYYQIAGHCFLVSGDKLEKAVGDMAAFSPFETSAAKPLFAFIEGDNAPDMQERLYGFSYEDVKCKFGKTRDGYMLTLHPSSEEPLFLWCDESEQVSIKGNHSIRLLRFALWIGYGLKTLALNTSAIHSSCIVYRNKAILFLGESGTGKSTHTRLWTENITGANLLNDDSPILRYHDNRLWAYGSPWSGKTACYKNEKYEVIAAVRLSQGPINKIRELPVLEAYGALHPSFSPGFAHDDALYECIGEIINRVLLNANVYYLECLPDAAAAMVSMNAVFKDRP